MKNKLVLTALLSTISFAITTPVFAQSLTNNSVGNIPNQGFNGPHHGINTVNQALDAGFFSDDMPVTLSGHIQASLGGKMYLFTDGTGEITVEIDHDKWIGQSITPSDKVQLSGDIDKDIGGVKVDVDSVRVIQ